MLFQYAIFLKKKAIELVLHNFLPVFDIFTTCFCLHRYHVCLFTVCGENANCNARNNRPECTCPPDFLGDPFSRCYTECTRHDECSATLVGVVPFQRFYPPFHNLKFLPKYVYFDIAHETTF